MGLRKIEGWQCPICSEKFLVRKALQQHRKEKHFNFEGFIKNNKFAGNHYIPITKCKFCERTFKTSSGLTLHQKTCINNPERVLVKSHKISEETKQKLSQKLKEIYKGKSIWATQIEKRKSYAEQYFDRCFPEAQKNYHVNRFFLDYAWPEKKCYLEVDGEQHYTESGLLHDQERTNLVKAEGWTLIARIRWKDFQKLTSLEKEEIIQSLKEAIQKIQEIKINFSTKEKRKKSLKEVRWELLQKANIDFQKFGWVKQVSELFGIAENKAGIYIKRNYPDFYINCYKRK